MKMKAVVAIMVAVLIALQMPIVALADYGTDTVVESGQAYSKSSVTPTPGIIPGENYSKLAQQYSIQEGGFVLKNETNYIVIENASTDATNAYDVVDGNPWDEMCGIYYNEGTVVINIGVIENNKGTIGIDEDDSVGNNGTINTNSATGIIYFNHIGGKVVTNNGSVKYNHGEITNNAKTVQTNTLVGTVTQSGADASVVENYGTVINAVVKPDGTIGYDDGAGTKVYGVTYSANDGKSALVNHSYTEGTQITISQGVTRNGYKFVKWECTDDNGTVTYYVDGEGVDVTNPMWLEAVWEKIQQTSSGGSSSWPSVPTSMGSVSAPISNGTWSDKDGKIQYTVNGETLKNATAWITYVPAGQTTPVTGCFYFDKNGNMLTGWQLIDGKWYYFNTVQGATYGAMLTDTTTPDGYRVGANGEWVKPQ